VVRVRVRRGRGGKSLPDLQIPKQEGGSGGGRLAACSKLGRRGQGKPGMAGSGWGEEKGDDRLKSGRSDGNVAIDPEEQGDCDCSKSH